MNTKTELHEGSILLFSSKSFIARAIQFFQRNRYNHAGLLVKLFEEWYVAEAEARGLVLNKLADRLHGNKVLMLTPKFEGKPAEITKTVVPMVGKHRYDFFSLLFFQMIYTITGWFNRPVWIGRRGNAAGKRLYCSEVCALVYHVVYGMFSQWWKYNPAMLYNSNQFTHHKVEVVFEQSIMPAPAHAGVQINIEKPGFIIQELPEIEMAQ